MKSQLQQLFQEILKELGITDVTPDVVISEDAKHGEYTTNIAMRLSKSLKKSPMVIAQEIVQKIHKHSHPISPKSPLSPLLQAIDRVEVAPPGFINVFLSEAKLSSQIAEVLIIGESYGTSQSGKGKHLMVEYTDPNPFKELHIGHLYSNAVGESLARLYEAIGWKVTRSDYFGDVGMHVAKSIWGVKQQLADFEKVQKQPISDRVRWLGQCYSKGATIFEEKSPEADKAKEEMKDINYMVYLAAQEYMQKALKWQPQVDYRQYVKVDNTLYKEVKELYETGRAWSMEYFETIFRRLGTKFDAYYPESIVGEYGAKLVREHLKDVFEKSDGAVVFRGAHTRVFLNSLGLPTYEAKELGLNWKKNQDYALDQSLIVTGNEINEYFKVLFEAMNKVIPDVAKKTKHIGHGMVRNADGSKMSSRTGNVLTGVGMLEEVKKSIYEVLKQNDLKYTKEEQEDIAEKASIAAIKYSLLRVALPSNVAFSIATSVSFDGDSGPYLLYTYARCKSVLRKASGQPSDNQGQALNSEEHQLARLITFFPEIVAAAAAELSPNVICTYLFQLAQTFNTFYQKHPILGEKHRLALTAATAQILKNGLYLLGISTVERM